MAGTLAIPFTFKTMAPPQSDVGNLDTDLTTIRDYVNNREITSGLGANRPAPGIAGRWWFSTDVAGGSLYFDNGAAWVLVAVGVGQAGAARVVGLVGANNAVTPNTKFDLAADSVTLRNPTTGATSTIANTGTLTCDIGAAGPVVNGRDQAGAFGANSWVHFYFIYDGSTLATLASATAPPTGPTLPGAYTLWAYAGAVRYNATPLLVATRMRGAWMSYDAQQNALNAGAAAVETAVSLATLIPPNAVNWRAGLLGTTAYNSATDSTHTFNFRVASGSDHFLYQYAVLGLSVAHVFGNQSVSLIVPNISQQFFYLGPAGFTPSFTVNVLGYEAPNGG